MLVLLFLKVFEIAVVTSLISCFPGPCDCKDRKNFLNTTCVLLCPTGFIENTYGCIKDLNSSQTLFALKFSDHWNFSTKEIDNYSLDPDFYDTNSSLPIFTKDRGFYFRTGNFIMSKKSWIVSPSFSLGLIVKVMNDGKMFQILEFEKYHFSLNTSYSSICFSLLLNSTNTGYFTDMTNQSVCLKISYNKWYIISSQFYQYYFYQQVMISLKSEYSSTTNSFFYYKDFLPQINGLNYTIGKYSEGFEGFLYEMVMSNDLSSTFTRLYKFIECEFGYYYDYLQNVCNPCSSLIETLSNNFNMSSNMIFSAYISKNFSEKALCTRRDSYCYSKNCQSCSGFIYDTCNNCSNSSELTRCDQDFFSVSNCSSNFIFLMNKSVCVNESTFPLASNLSFPSFEMNFSTFEQKFGGIFQSGSKLETYAPFNNPESDDPLPVKGRGLYFNGTTYLKSTIAISLNIEFTIAFWIWPTSGVQVDSDLWSSDFLILRQNGVGRFCFTDGFSVFCKYCFGTLSTNSMWNLISYVVSYNEIEKKSTIKLIQDFSNFQILSIEGHIFFNTPSVVYIGKGSQNFMGYIFKIAIWNSPFIINKNSLNFCTSYKENCASTFDIRFYLNSFKSIIEECHKNCTEGCVEWGRCNICKYADCSNCSSFTSNCTESNTSDCLDGLILSKNRKCCHVNCEECFGMYIVDCLSCTGSKLLADGACLDDCPLGYMKDTISQKCTKIYSKSLYVKFDKLLKNFTDSISFKTFGEIGTFFTNFSKTDPIPVFQRGLFFNDSRKISSEKVILPINFMVELYINIQKAGQIFSKGNISLSYNNSMYIITFGQLSTLFNSTSSFQWTRLIFGFKTTLTRTNKVILNENSLISIISINDIWFIDSKDPLFLGGSESFTGFIYQLSIYSYSTLLDINSFTIPSCSLSNQSNCLSTCQFNEFLTDSSDCSKCNNCSYGCHSEKHCNPCLDKHCENCSGFQALCLSCEKGYVLENSSCGCTPGKYKNDLDCLPCDFNCLECDMNANNCTKCGNFTKILNNSCQCLDGFVEDTQGNFSSLNCRCPENSSIKNLSCFCNPGYAKVNDSCLICHERCLTCSGINLFNCLTCRAIFDSGICRDNCSLGFEIKENKCIKVHASNNIFKLKFDQIKLPKSDQINNISIEYSGGSKRSRRLSNTPSSIFLRGIYFNGISNYLKFPSQSLNISILNYEFSISIWFFPYDATGIFLTQSLGKKISLALSLVNKEVNVSIMLDSNLHSFLSSLKVSLISWNNFAFLIKYNYSTESVIFINERQGNLNTISQYPFEEPINSVITIGKRENHLFKGFLYSIIIYNDFVNLQTLKSETVFCGLSNNTECLSSCEISSYYDYELGECLSCNKKCDLGCRSSISCTQCLDQYCEKCESFYSNCSECQENYELIESTCVPCGDEFYYDFTDKSCKFCEKGSFPSKYGCVVCSKLQFFDAASKTCQECDKLCTGCYSKYNCSSCIENAFLSEDSICKCLQGFDPNDFCSFIPRNFSAWAKVSLNNEVNLEFSEELNQSLEEKSLNVTLNLTKVQYSLRELSRAKYIIKIVLPIHIEKGTRVEIIILAHLKSIFNSSLTTSSLQIILFPQQASKMETLVIEAKAVAKQGVSAGLSAAIGSSFLSFDPTSFFSFLSTAELYYPLSLFACNLPDDLAAFLASLRVQSMMPNIFELGIEKDSGSKIPEKFKKIGFKNNLLLINTGINLTVAIILVIIMAVIKLLSYSEIIKPYIKKIRNMFEYGIFIKFWVQSYLELLLGSLITIKFNTFSTSLESFDFLLGIVLIVTQFLGLGYLFFLILKRTRVDDENIQKFSISFGVIFDEFKSYGISFWIFYLLYVTRRLFLIFFAVFADEGIVQVTICLCFSLMILFYVLFTRCFKNPISNIYMIINESLAFATSLVLMLHLIGKSWTAENTNTHITRIITTAWVLNIVYGISLLAHKIALKFFKRKHSKVLDINNITSFDQTGAKSEKPSISEFSENSINETYQNQGGNNLLKDQKIMFKDEKIMQDDNKREVIQNPQTWDIQVNHR